MKTICSAAALAALVLTSCAPGRNSATGVVADITENTVAVVSPQGDTMRFNTVDAERIAPQGVMLRDTAVIHYEGRYADGMAPLKIEVAPRPIADASLGEWRTRVWEGVLPAADGPGIRYRLTVRNQEHSGDGDFALTMTYLEAENGEDRSFSYAGRRFTQRGMPWNDDAEIWQMVAVGGDDIFNFLCEDEDTLTLLNNRFEKSSTELNYSLKLVETL